MLKNIIRVFIPLRLIQGLDRSKTSFEGLLLEYFLELSFRQFLRLQCFAKRVRLKFKKKKCYINRVNRLGKCALVFYLKTGVQQYTLVCTLLCNRIRFPTSRYSEALLEQFSFHLFKFMFTSYFGFVGH